MIVVVSGSIIIHKIYIYTLYKNIHILKRKKKFNGVAEKLSSAYILCLILFHIYDSYRKNISTKNRNEHPVSILYIYILILLILYICFIYIQHRIKYLFFMLYITMLFLFLCIFFHLTSIVDWPKLLENCLDFCFF